MSNKEIIPHSEWVVPKSEWVAGGVVYPPEILTKGLSKRAFRMYLFIEALRQSGNGVTVTNKLLREKYNLSESHVYRGLTELRERGFTL